MKSALMQILKRVRIVIELLLIESGGLFKQRDRVGFWSGLCIQVGEALTERCMAG